MGTRVDGIGNDIAILSGTRVYANGVNGLGVLLSYGMDHNLTQRGDVEALGENGIAVSFDLGHNSMGDANEYRGSYFVTFAENNLEDDFPDYYVAVLAEMSDPLIKNFDLSGRVTGSKAAIYMADSAYVDRMNIMQGASITGDIVSNYQGTNAFGYLRITTCGFGQEADDEDRATSKSDANFSISYADNIIGDNVSLQLLGSASVLTGSYDLYEVIVENDATLIESGEYEINNLRFFNTRGTLYSSQIGGVITVKGNYAKPKAACCNWLLTMRNKSSNSM